MIFILEYSWLRKYLPGLRGFLPQLSEIKGEIVGREFGQEDVDTQMVLTVVRFLTVIVRYAPNPYQFCTRFIRLVTYRYTFLIESEFGIEHE